MSKIINEDIRSYRVLLIDENGTKLGEFNRNAAIQMAYEKNLDLVQISIGPNEIPVTKMLDAGKYFYEKEKTFKAQRSAQRAKEIQLKEIQLRPVTDTGDLNVKANRTKEFLSVGDLVKIVMRFKGREQSNKAVGFDTMQEFIDLIPNNLYTVEQQLQDSGKQIIVVLKGIKQ